MINERNSGLSTNPSTSSNMSYGDPTGLFERMNLQAIPSPTEVHPYYLSNFYQQFGSFDDRNQWTTTDPTGSLTSGAGTISYHPSMYAPSPPFDASRNSFEYSSTGHNFSHFHHPGFSPASNYSGPSASGASNFDIPWNGQNITGQHQPIQLASINPIGSNSLIGDKTSIYDHYSSNNNHRMDDLFAQRFNLMELSNNPTNRVVHQKYSQLPFEQLSNSGNFFSKDSLVYPTNSNNFSSVPQAGSNSTSTVQKSYALVVSSDASNRNSSLQTTNNINSNRSFSDSNSSKQQQAPNFMKNFHSMQNSSSTSADYHNSNPTVKSSERVMNNNDNVNRRQISARTKSMTKQNAVKSETLENLKRKNQYNPKEFNLNPKGARFFVIKSYSEDDIHRSIKYNIWCSTEHGNKRLDSAFREREGKGPIYLFFSVNGSGHFCGMAEMMSAVDHEHKTDVWHMSNKWQGKFEIKWIYVKDVPNQHFRHIRLENNENKPVTNSRDTQEIPYEKGKIMLKSMHSYDERTSIFDDFLYYESKQSKEDSK